MANQKRGRQSFILPDPPVITHWASVAGKKESEGPLAHTFDVTSQDTYFGQKTWEQGEKQMQKLALGKLAEKANMKLEDFDLVFSGDLLNQCIGSSFTLRNLGIPHLGLYGACSTMAESLLLSSMAVGGGFADNAVAMTSSHFASSERQYRFPLGYGGQRTPTAQWTCTASGAVVLAPCQNAPYLRAVTIGRIVDYGITDANNMGAAMAPAAADTILRFLADTGASPREFDAIVTGDLGLIGSKLLCEILQKEGVDIRKQHRDCGAMMFDPEQQDTHAGGSGCGCSASVLCGYFLPRIRTGELKNILFAATGALMSPTASQQGESIPGISHLIHISADKKGGN